MNRSTSGFTKYLCSAIAANTGLLDKVTLVNATSSQNGEPMIRATGTALAGKASVTVPLTFTYPSIVTNPSTNAIVNGTYLNSTMSACCSTTTGFDTNPVSTIQWCSGPTGQPYQPTNGATGGSYCLNPIVYQE